MCAGNINHAESNTLITYLFVVDFLFDINCYLSVLAKEYTYEATFVLYLLKCIQYHLPLHKLFSVSHSVFGQHPYGYL